MALRSSGRLARALAGVALASVALTGCGDDVGDNIASRLPTALPTLPSLPTSLPTLPSLPTRPPAETVPPAETAPPVETTTPPVAAPTPAPPAETAPSVETPTVPPVAEEGEEAAVEDGGLGWWWLVILLLTAAAIAVGVLLVRRRQARAAWDEGVTRAVGEATWLADELVPNLLAQGSHGRAGVWAIGRRRVLALERSLEELVADRPDPAEARPVAALASAVQAIRSALDQADMLPDFGGFSTTAALRQARLEIDEAVRTLRPPEEAADSTPAR
ncbi:MAG: hypothetical protein ACQERF_01155 [Actinomycetota bacterium]